MSLLPRLRSSAALSLVLTVIVPFRIAAQEPKVIAVRHWTLGPVTRIVIESTAQLHFKTDRLHNPDRVFFDLAATRSQLPGFDHKGIAVIDVGDQFVRQIRVSETQNGVTRVVCDLTASVEFTTSQLTNPDRLIIDLRSPQLTRGDRDSTIIRVDPSSPPRHAPLDFAASLARRQAASHAVSITIPDPPSPFDPGARFARRGYFGADPLAKTSWAPRVYVSRSLPPLIPERRRPTPELAKGTASLIAKPGLRTSPEEVGLPAKSTSREDTMIRVLGLKLGRVVIDPGHGGTDAGTSSDEGLREKDIVLDVARRLGSLIEQRLGSEVVYTRTDDRFVALGRRTALANEKKADLFLSIHVNSSPARSAAGVETFYLNFTSSRDSLETAMRENAGADRNVGELQDLLKKIALKDKVEESRAFASSIQTSLVTLIPKAARSSNDRGVKRAPFVVLIGASMPSVLAEIGFISNPQEEAQMRRPEHRQKIAEALYKGLAAYANTLSHFDVAQQRKLAKTAASAAATQ